MKILHFLFKLNPIIIVKFSNSIADLELNLGCDLNAMKLGATDEVDRSTSSTITIIFMIFKTIVMSGEGGPQTGHCEAGQGRRQGDHIHMA